MVRVSESYQAEGAPPWMRVTVERLLQSVPEDLLGSLGTVVLTDSASIGGGKTQRLAGRKYNRSECRGFYHAATRQEPAWIELVADNMVARWPKPVLTLRLARDVVVAQTLFHELGHHLSATVGARARSHEAAAEDWRLRLSRGYFRKRYGYLRLPIRVALLLLTPLRGLTSQLSGRASRAARRER